MKAKEVIEHVDATYGTTFTPLVLVTAKGKVIATNRVTRYPDDFQVVIAGPKPVATHLRNRHEGWAAQDLIAHAQRLGDIQLELLSQRPTLGLEDSIVKALRVFDPNLCDVEHLWLNGATYATIARLMNLSIRQVQGQLDLMRGMGFVLPHRNEYARRHSKSASSRLGN